MSKDEQVLCVEREAIEAYAYPFSGFTRDMNYWQQLRGLRPDAFSFVKRDKCETDPGLKQIIPYAIVHGSYLLTYWRSKEGAEQRLHGKRSIGIGGHINLGDRDALDGDIGLLNLIKSGTERELDEELRLVADGDECKYQVSLAGFVNDDSNQVGSVHLGVVLLVNVGGGNEITSKHSDNEQASFENPAKYFGYYNPEVHEQFEGWSKTLLTSNSIWRDGEFLEGAFLWDSKLSRT
jgi:predicted NUDIX family phosphoesterase